MFNHISMPLSGTVEEPSIVMMFVDGASCWKPHDVLFNLKPKIHPELSVILSAFKIQLLLFTYISSGLGYS